MKPILEQHQSVVPERVDLHRLSAARRHHPIVHLGVHPGELVSFGTCSQQTVRGIHADTEARAAQMMVDDIDQLRQRPSAELTDRRRFRIAIHRVEEPQRRVGSVI